MTDETEVAINDREAYLDAVSAVEAVKCAPTGGTLDNVPGATDASSSTSEAVSKVLAEARAVLPTVDTAISGAVTSLRALYTQVTGIDTAGETGVKEA
ncbi:hypothetical protein ACP6C7_03855 [Mycolicibacterium septicum]|uniref:Uncharacterized protein n=1 Tax=Mycolicibacterium septicum TaxID=98668 RepID=A0ABW9LSK2_9MYCO